MYGIPNHAQGRGLNGRQVEILRFDWVSTAYLVHFSHDNTSRILHCSHTREPGAEGDVPNWTWEDSPGDDTSGWVPREEWGTGGEEDEEEYEDEEEEAEEEEQPAGEHQGGWGEGGGNWNWNPNRRRRQRHRTRPSKSPAQKQRKNIRKKEKKAEKEAAKAAQEEQEQEDEHPMEHSEGEQPEGGDPKESMSAAAVRHPMTKKERTQGDSPPPRSPPR